jgi:hypothetical protein
VEFKIYKAGGEMVIAWNTGGVRIASPVELAMWSRIAELETALRVLIVAVESCDGTAQIDLTDAKRSLTLGKEVKP